VGECFTVTDGQISNYEKDDKILYYRFTAPSFFGNSGGGLFNDNGELIGVVDALSTYNLRGSTTVVPGGYFAVSLQTINKFMKN
jgi:S1-C subfamily serine protease